MKQAVKFTIDPRPNDLRRTYKCIPVKVTPDIYGAPGNMQGNVDMYVNGISWSEYDLNLTRVAVYVHHKKYILWQQASSS